MRLVRILGGTVLVLLLLIAGYLVMVESGEVVVLETRDAAGAAHQTRVWAVDADGSAWLRTGDPKSPWLARLRANPEIAVTRGGERREYRAVLVEDAATRERINALELEKYGLAEKVLRAVMMDPAGTTPIRLEPR